MVLEDRFPQCKFENANVRGIIILGGFIDEKITSSRGQISLNGSSERLIIPVIYKSKHPWLKLLFSGGSPKGVAETEAMIINKYFLELGINKPSILYEDVSRNTYENAIFSKIKIQDYPNFNWLLVTSAIHMPRAIGSFRKAGIQVTPCPVDYRTTRDIYDWFSTIDPVNNISLTSSAMREWFGLIVYRIRDRIDEFLPRP